MDFLWLYLIVGVIFNGLLSLVGAYVASEKGRSGPAFWLLGFLLSFLIALLVAIGIPEIKEDSNSPDQRYSHKKCPDCAEQILIEANKCKHCGAKQQTRKTSSTDVRRKTSSTDVRSWCPSCRSESTIPSHSACPNCGEATHPWE